MKHIFLSLTFLLFSAISPSAYAQLADGNYTFSNADNILQFTITDSGFSIENALLTNKSSGRSEKQTGGEFMNQGGMEWYQFQTEFCNYNFDVPKKMLKLDRFGCKDKKDKNTTIKLKQN